jgi:hypothetical protein
MSTMLPGFSFPAANSASRIGRGPTMASPAPPLATSRCVAAAPWVVNMILSGPPLSNARCNSLSAGRIFPVVMTVISAPSEVA